MKAVTIILIGLTASALALPIQQSQIAEGWNIPQSDGTFRWITAAQLDELTASERKEGKISFYLYTNQSPNSPELIEPNNAASLKKSKFNAAHPTRFIIHGWKHDYAGELSIVLMNALFKIGQYNVICVDWSEDAGGVYLSAMQKVSNVGQRVASFIDFLHNQGGMALSSLSLLGHSLGAHVSGYAGKNVRSGKIAEIIALDPAMPGFSYNKPDGRLNSNDAAYVESIQTCGGLLGFLEPIGKATFYPNGGVQQPGCGIDIDGGCRHARSYRYYAEAIVENNFPSVKCSSHQSALDKACGSNYSSVKLGNSKNYAQASGYFYTPVHSKSPFGLGTNKILMQNIL